MSLSPPASPQIERILRLLSARTGLSFGPGQSTNVVLGIERAMNRSGETDPTRYFDLLQSSCDALDDLIVELTVGETYFFRQPGQFDFLRRRVLPDVRQRHGDQHMLRIWSAGCASGEEAYSLAIVFHEQGLAHRTRILATDISRMALDKARQAIYRDWSLRGEGAELARRYLRRTSDGFAVDQQIHEMVTFEQLNLAVDLYPSIATGASGMDLIFCRNVLIYFDAGTIRRVACRLHDSLLPGGWLMTAATDPPLGDFAPFEIAYDEAGVFYQRRCILEKPEKTADTARDEPVNVDQHVGSIPQTPPASAMQPTSVIDELDGVSHEDQQSAAADPCQATVGTGRPTAAEVSRLVREALANGNYAQATDLTRDRLDDPELSVLHVRALANLDARQAEEFCVLAITRYRLSVELYYLHAVLLMELGRDDAAAEAVRRVIYLDRSSALGHFTLGAILLRRGDLSGARRHFRNAHQLCLSCPPDETIPLSEGETAARLAEAAAARVAQLDAALDGG